MSTVCRKCGDYVLYGPDHPDPKTRHYCLQSPCCGARMKDVSRADMWTVYCEQCGLHYDGHTRRDIARRALDEEDQ